MIRSSYAARAAPEPRVVPTADGSLTVLSPDYGESYHSRHGALSEARHVFLEASGVAARLAAGRPSEVLEVGFGTGLNALLTIDAAVRTGASLRYVALERDLLPADILSALGYRDLLADPALADALVAWRRGLPEPVRRAGAPALGDDGAEPAQSASPNPAANAAHALQLGSARLELLLGEARQARLPAGVHAVYHDAFSPGVNPELWDEAFLTRLFAALAPAGRLVTYTVQGALRRRLLAIGFTVSKVPGPPAGKREVLVARRMGPAQGGP